MPAFVSGLELNRRFYTEVVQQLLHASFPDLPYAAALIGPGSETLGFDTEMSMDHDWGLHFFLLLKDEDIDQRDAISNMLSRKLPATFLDIPVSLSAIPIEPRMRIMKRPVSGPTDHCIIPLILRDFVSIQLGYDLSQPLQAMDWLSLSPAALGEFVAGAVYHDGVGDLTALRQRLAWYPDDIWLYLLASGWQRIGQEEHLMPRAGSVGDELGSAIIGSRLIRDIMNLCFLMEKRYAPYPKWFGSAFKRLRCAQDFEPIFWRAQQATIWQERQDALAQAYEKLASLHNALDIGDRLPETVSPFFGRPFQVIHGERFVRALTHEIVDPEVRDIAERLLIGNIAQWSDNTDIGKVAHETLRHLYE